MKKTIEELKSSLFNDEFDVKTDTRFENLGDFNLNEEGVEETERYKTIKWAYEKVGGPKLVKWKDVNRVQMELVTKHQALVATFGQTTHSSYLYHSLMPEGYTHTPDKQRPGNLGFAFKNVNGEYVNFKDILDYSKGSMEFEALSDDMKEEQIGSAYYHSAKAHWLTQHIRREGLWNPIQGKVERRGDQFAIAIHPGSVRSQVLELLSLDDLDCLITDRYGLFDQEPMTWDEMLDYHREITKEGCTHDNISFLYSRGYIEISSAAAHKGGTDFRPQVFEFNKKVTELSKGKKITIYVGYDSRHGDLAQNSADIIKYHIKQNFGGGNINSLFDWEPEVKLLDKAKISEYTRDYANQSTEFTYTRFLVPYLENYEGFSIFVDDDFIFSKSILPLFHFLNPEDAVACVQYDFDNIHETKFNGEKNVAYPKKLWSSLMIFNNGHPDCKKLTPEVVNTESGKYLHQFEWTDAISEIPERWVITEGTDDLKSKPSAFAIHYTRGGPWIKDMNTSRINMLENYENMVRKVANKPKV